MSDNAITCRDGCGRSVEPDKLEHSGWTLLPIQNRYRCPQCWREMELANGRTEEQSERPGETARPVSNSAM